MKPRFLPIKTYLAGGLILLILILFAGFIISSDFFQVKQINIIGAERLNRDEIRLALADKILTGRLAKYLGFNNLLVWKNGAIALNIPQVAEALIGRDFPKREINIKITEKEKLFVWCEGGETCFWLDGAGVALYEAPFIEGRLVYLVKNFPARNLVLGMPALEKNKFDNFKKIIELIKAESLDLSDIVVKDLSEITLRTKIGPELYFDLKNDPSFAAPIVKELRRKGEFNKLAYLDFRIENKAYYK